MELNLTIPPTRNRITGQFIRGHRSHQTGKKWDEWIPKEKQEKILAALAKTRKGNYEMYKVTQKRTVMVKDGRIIGVFESATEAHRRTGIPLATITKLCRHETKTPRSEFLFFYENDPILFEVINKTKIDN